MTRSYRIANWLMLAMIALAIVQCIYIWPQLPDTMSSHYDGSGAPNGWSSKTGFFAFYIALLALLYVCFTVVPAWRAATKPQRFVVSNSDYWMAPERREPTIRVVRRRVAWLGVVHLIMMLAVTQLVFDANLKAQPLSDIVYLILLGYFIVFIAWFVALYRYFHNTP